MDAKNILFEIERRIKENQNYRLKMISNLKLNELKKLIAIELELISLHDTISRNLLGETKNLTP